MFQQTQTVSLCIDCADPPTAGATFCADCICSLVEVYLPAFRAANITVEPNNPQSFPIDEATQVIAACTQQYFVSMMLANVNTTGLEQLTTCNFANTSNVPPCLSQKIATLAGPAPPLVALGQAANSTDFLYYDVSRSIGGGSGADYAWFVAHLVSAV